MVVSRQLNYNISVRGYSYFINKKALKIKACGVSQTPNRKEIKKGLDAWVEFWGVNEDGKYMCLFVTSPWKRGWKIDEEGKSNNYYYVIIDTKENKAEKISVKWLKNV